MLSSLSIMLATRSRYFGSGVSSSTSSKMTDSRNFSTKFAVAKRLQMANVALVDRIWELNVNLTLVKGIGELDVKFNVEVTWSLRWN